ncbi:PHP-associated domain-containing protein [Verrucomicrobiota bacterium]
MAVTTSSDAHRLKEIGAARTRFMVEEGTAAEIGMAFRQEKGRRLLARQ